MNDRFKFRVWNKSTNSFTTGGAIKFGGLCFVDTEDFGIKPAQDQENYIIEQCTGLKDKNGNLIYEGDILFVKTLDWKNKEIWNAGEVRTYWSVEYKDYWNHRGFMVFGINRRFHKPLTRTTIFNSEAVVFGNIHENKELLDER